MQIQYLNHSSFLIKIRVNGVLLTVLTDPFNPNIGIPFKKVKADLVTVSHLHNDHCYLQCISNLKKPLDLKTEHFYMNGNEEPFIVSKPGDYELKGVRITGIDSYHDDKKGSFRGHNTIFVIRYKDLSVCHLGDLGHILTDSQIEEIGDVDVLLVPVGGFYTIDSEQASKVIAQIEPNYVIPMHYKTKWHSKDFDKIDPLSKFLEVMGQESLEPMDKFNVVKSANEDTELVLLKPLYKK